MTNQTLILNDYPPTIPCNISGCSLIVGFSDTGIAGYLYTVRYRPTREFILSHYLSNCRLYLRWIH